MLAGAGKKFRTAPSTRWQNGSEGLFSQPTRRLTNFPIHVLWQFLTVSISPRIHPWFRYSNWRLGLGMFGRGPGPERLRHVPSGRARFSRYRRRIREPQRKFVRGDPHRKRGTFHLAIPFSDAVPLSSPSGGDGWFKNGFPHAQNITRGEKFVR